MNQREKTITPSRTMTIIAFILGGWNGVMMGGVFGGTFGQNLIVGILTFWITFGTLVNANFTRQVANRLKELLTKEN